MDIKEFKTFTVVTLKDKTTLYTEASVNDVAKYLNSSEFVVIDWVGINKFEVLKFEPYKPNDIEHYILSQPQPTRKQLQSILNDRNERQLQTNWVQHLIEIHKSKFTI